MNAKKVFGALSVVAIILAFYQLLSASPFLILSGYAQAGIHWLLLSTFILLAYPLKGTFGKILDVVFMILGWVCVYGLFVASQALVDRAGMFSAFEICISVCQIILALVIGWRVLGKALPLICIFFLLYALFGSSFPAPFKIARLSLQRLAPYLLVSSEGLFGLALITCARFIFLFILFGAFLEFSGAGEFFVELAFSITGKIRGGPAQAAIYSSMLMGMVNGSGPANVVTTGTFTIPLMKKIGFDSNTAGAIEAVASNGGQIMPPVMGAVAFLVSEATGIPYSSIAFAALVPAVLYYITLSTSVLVYSHKFAIPVAPSGEKKAFEILKGGWYYFVPIIVLTFLLVRGISPQRSALIAIFTIICITIFFKREKCTTENFVNVFRKAAFSMCAVSVACLLAGIITGCINITGIGLRISGIVRSLSGGSMLLMLILTMFVCIILGMGLPTSAAYIVLAVLIAPALIKLGVSKIASHMFILYFGTMATLTPPVALAVFAACGISGGTLWKTGLQSMRLAAAGFLIPFIFVYNNELLLIGSPIHIVFSIFTAMLGCMLLAVALFGWFYKNLNFINRIILLICSVALIMPKPFWINCAGFVVAGVILFFQKRRTITNE